MNENAVDVRAAAYERPSIVCSHSFYHGVPALAEALGKRMALQNVGLDY
jgi:hypothetical protein